MTYLSPPPPPSRTPRCNPRNSRPLFPRGRHSGQTPRPPHLSRHLPPPTLTGRLLTHQFTYSQTCNKQPPKEAQKVAA